MNYPGKAELLDRGIKHAVRFCVANGLEIPAFEIVNHDWPFGCCAYYRPGKVVVHPPHCAVVGLSGQAWSFPGWTVDRTPYGVVAHEIGHHADYSTATKTRGKYFSNFSREVRAQSGEPKLTNYCENDAEWFAEIFRLFITNPDLLRIIRPKTFEILSLYFVPVETRSWREVLATAPERTRAQAEKVVGKA